MQDAVQSSTLSPYAYPLLIKQLLHTPFVQAPDQEIVYRGQLRMTYSTLRERIARLARRRTIPRTPTNPPAPRRSTRREPRACPRASTSRIGNWFCTPSR